nr:ATP-binding cassette domain-containing protein [Longirhabdus pacifica]
MLKHKGIIKQDEMLLSMKERIKESFLVMQDVNSQLFTKSVEEELLLSVKNESNASLEEIVTLLGLEEDKESHPMALSGGQKQRVAIACAAIAEKQFIVYDEPTSGLDYENMIKMSKLIAKMKDNTYATIVITHDLELILSSCDRVIHLEDGTVKEDYELNAEGIERVKFFFIHLS